MRWWLIWDLIEGPVSMTEILFFGTVQRSVSMFFVSSVRCLWSMSQYMGLPCMNVEHGIFSL